MSNTYTEIPTNYEEISSLFVTDVKDITKDIIFSKRVLFYDTCSFRKHANMNENGRNKVIEYFKLHDSIVVITRIILMELASISGIINEEYLIYLNAIVDSGIKVILLDEEDLFDVMSECFSTNAKANECLMWAVRVCQSPVSTIRKTLNEDSKLSEEILKGKDLSRSDIYHRFFMKVRKNKEHDDNLGEELIGICVFILAHLPGIKDGKIYVLTEDKGAAAKLWAMYRRTNSGYRGSKSVLISTSKLVQFMYKDKMELSKEDMISILSQGLNDNLVVMGTTAYDLKVDEKISITCEELVEKICEPNEINIVF